MRLGIFCVVARTELKEKDPNVSDEALYYLNYAIKQSFNLGVATAKADITKMSPVEIGTFIHAGIECMTKDLVDKLDFLERRLEEVHSWAVCAPITTPEDMLQNIDRIIEITDPAYREE